MTSEKKKRGITKNILSLACNHYSTSHFELEVSPPVLYFYLLIVCHLQAGQCPGYYI